MADKELNIKLDLDRTKAQAAANAEQASLRRVVETHRNAMVQMALQEQKRFEMSAAAQQKQISQDRRKHDELRQQDNRTSELMVKNLVMIRDQLKASSDARIRLAKAASDAEAGGLGKSNEAGGQLLGTLGRLGGTIAIFGAIKSAASAFANELERAAVAAEKSGFTTTDKRADIRELAMIKGQAGDTGKTERQLLELRNKTLQSRQEAMQFEKEMFGSGASFLSDAQTKRRMSREEFGKLETMMGAQQAMTGMDAGRVGGFAGILPLALNKPAGQEATADEAARLGLSLVEMFQKSAAPPAVLMEQFRKTISLTTTGAFRNAGEQGALMGAMGSIMGEGTGDATQQFVRATSGSLMRMRGGAVMEGLTEDGFQKRAEYLQGIGAKPGMDAISIGRLIAGDMQTKEQGYIQAGKSREEAAALTRTYLEGRGYNGSIEDITALSTFKTVLPELDKSFMPTAQNPPKLADSMEPVNRFRRGDPLAMQRKRELASDAATAAEGMGGQEFVNELRRAIFETMKARGDADPIFGKAGVKVTGTFEEFTAGKTGMVRAAAIDQAAAKFLNQQLPRDQQIDLTQAWEGFGVGSMLDAGGRAKTLGQQAMRVRAAGGNVVPGAGQAIGEARKAEALLERANVIGEQQLKAMQAPGVPNMRPAPPPLRPPVRPQAGAMR